MNVVKSEFESLLQGQIMVAKLKCGYNFFEKVRLFLILGATFKIVVDRQKRVSCPFSVYTSCIWPQMRPWSSCDEITDEVQA